LILDAGSGSGNLAEALGLSNACFFDFTWEQIKRCWDKGCPGHLIQGDIQQLRLMKDAHLLDLKELVQPNLQILDSSTVVFLPPYFQAQRNLLRQGLWPTC